MKSYVWNFTYVCTIPVKFDINFLWLQWEIVFGVITDNYYYIHKPLKNVKKNVIWLNLFWYKVFV